MSLAIMACLGPQSAFSFHSFYSLYSPLLSCFTYLDPALFREFSESLIDLLVRSPPLALSQILAGSPQGESVRAIINHTVSVITLSTKGKFIVPELC